MIFDHIGLFVRDIDALRRQLQAPLPIESRSEVIEAETETSTKPIWRGAEDDR